MENLDQGFFASGLDSFDMGVIQNRRPGWTSGGLERSPKVDHNEEIREDFTRVFPVVLFPEIQSTFFVEFRGCVAFWPRFWPSFWS